MTSERRVDPFLGTPVHVVTTRQDRPNLPSDECPFCVGGQEAPDQYSVSECSQAEAEIGPLRLANLSDIEEITDLTVRSRARHVISENERVTTFAQALASNNDRAAGEIMAESHHSLAHNFDVSTSTINAAVDELSRIPGVYGARMTGGGFGGCVVALCEPGVDIDAWIVSPVGGAQRFDDDTDDMN